MQSKFIQNRRALNRAEADDMLDVLIQSKDKNGEPLSDQVIRENTLAQRADRVLRWSHLGTVNAAVWESESDVWNPC